MKLQLLGTGAATGWPQPGCTCSSCRRAQHDPRRPTEVLVDEVVRLGPEASWSDISGQWVAQQLPIEGQAEPAVAVLLRSPAGTGLLHTSVASPVSAQALDSAVGCARTVAGVLLSQGRATMDEVAAEIARLRRLRAVSAGATFVVVGLGHQNPPEPELVALAGAWGATIAADNTEVLLDDVPVPGGDAQLRAGLDEPSLGSQLPAPRRTLRTLVIGGTRSGKSRWAERQLAADPDVCYIATAPARKDPEWADRVALHRQRRPAHWNTVETPAVAQLLGATPSGQSLLVDDLGNWVTTMIEATHGWDGDRTQFRQAADELVEAWQDFAGRAVLVSNDVGAGVHPATHAGRVFADEIGSLNSALAAQSDEVVVITAGLARWLRRPNGTIEP